jgi:hypothetical protein
MDYITPTVPDFFHTPEVATNTMARDLTPDIRKLARARIENPEAVAAAEEVAAYKIETPEYREKRAQKARVTILGLVAEGKRKCAEPAS